MFSFIFGTSFIFKCFVNHLPAFYPFFFGGMGMSLGDTPIILTVLRCPHVMSEIELGVSNIHGLIPWIYCLAHFIQVNMNWSFCPLSCPTIIHFPGKIPAFSDPQHFLQLCCFSFTSGIILKVKLQANPSLFTKVPRPRSQEFVIFPRHHCHPVTHQKSFRYSSEWTKVSVLTDWVQPGTGSRVPLKKCLIRGQFTKVMAGLKKPKSDWKLPKTSKRKHHAVSTSLKRIKKWALWNM